MIRTSKAALAAIVSLGIAGTPVSAPAQKYSDSFTFLKAVKDRDGNKATEILANPASNAINSREASSGEGALHILVRDRDSNWLAFLLGKGARTDLEDRNGDTPLSMAAQIGWVEGAQMLLGRRANVNAANRAGVTPLILAVQRRDVAMVRLLLASGADPKRADNVTGLSAIDYAKRDNRADTVLRLLEAPQTPARPMVGPTF